MGTPKTTPKPDAERTHGVHVRLLPSDLRALRDEAYRRVQDGEATRIDVSKVITGLVRAWREARS